MLILFAGVVLVGVLAYVRLAPSDVTRWHQPVEGAADKDGTGYAVRVVQGDATTLAGLHSAMLDLPRTTRLAGSVDEGRITYITRSARVGFPDYTTFQLADGQIRMFARLRFGRSDIGVNAARLERLVATLQTGG